MLCMIWLLKDSSFPPLKDLAQNRCKLSIASAII
ncbi:hypothetical protein T09_8958 [Trichinella sp. T9]|nr:hypothetical protein T09_8958 [Trichinella sp. T9]